MHLFMHDIITVHTAYYMLHIGRYLPKGCLTPHLELMLVVSTNHQITYTASYIHSWQIIVVGVNTSVAQHGTKWALWLPGVAHIPGCSVSQSNHLFSTSTLHIVWNMPRDNVLSSKAHRKFVKFQATANCMVPVQLKPELLPKFTLETVSQELSANIVLIRLGSNTTPYQQIVSPMQETSHHQCNTFDVGFLHYLNIKTKMVRENQCKYTEIAQIQSCQTGQL